MIRIIEKDKPAYILWGVQHGFQTYDRINIEVDQGSETDLVCDELRNLFDLNIQGQRIFSIKQHKNSFQLSLYKTISDGASRNGFYAIAVLVDEKYKAQTVELFQHILSITDLFDQKYLTKDTHSRLIFRTKSPKLFPLLSQNNEKLDLQKNKVFPDVASTNDQIACVYEDIQQPLLSYISRAQEQSLNFDFYLIPSVMKGKAYIPVWSKQEVTQRIEVVNRESKIELLIRDANNKPVEGAKVDIYIPGKGKYKEESNKSGKAVFMLRGYATEEKAEAAINKIDIRKKSFEDFTSSSFNSLIKLRKKNVLTLKITNKERFNTKPEFKAFWLHGKKNRKELKSEYNNKKIRITMPDYMYIDESDIIRLELDNHRALGYRKKQKSIRYHSIQGVPFLKIQLKQKSNKLLKFGLLSTVVGIITVALLYIMKPNPLTSEQTRAKDNTENVPNNSQRQTIPEKSGPTMMPEDRAIEIANDDSEDTTIIEKVGQKNEASEEANKANKGLEETTSAPEKDAIDPRKVFLKKIRSSDDFNQGLAVPWKADIEAYLQKHPQENELKRHWEVYKRYQNYVYNIRAMDQKKGEEYKKILGSQRGTQPELTPAQKTYIKKLNQEYKNRANKKWPEIRFKI